MLMENRKNKQTLVPRSIPEPYPTLPMFSTNIDRVSPLLASIIISVGPSLYNTPKLT